MLRWWDSDGAVVEMDGVFEWLRDNRAWVFGVGVSALGLLFAVVKWLASRRSDRFSQSQKGGDHSVNLQAGGDIRIGTEPSRRAEQTDGR